MNIRSIQIKAHNLHMALQIVKSFFTKKRLIFFVLIFILINHNSLLEWVNKYANIIDNLITRHEEIYYLIISLNIILVCHLQWRNRRSKQECKKNIKNKEL